MRYYSSWVFVSVFESYQPIYFIGSIFEYFYLICVFFFGSNWMAYYYDML